MKKKTLQVTIISILLTISIAASSLEISSTAKTQQEFTDTKTSNPNELGVSEHKITSQELQEMKNEVGVQKEGKNYNQVVNGYGTGLSPPTAEEWSEIAENTRIIDNISYGSPTAVDNSDTPWFPPIGNQGSQGSCTAWAVGYYVKTYQEAKEHSWNLSGATWAAGQPTVSYQSHIMSPAFIYNLINEGVDLGSSYQKAIQLVCNIGISSWQKTPYDPLDDTTWPSEGAWAEAPFYRSNSSYGYQYLYVNSSEGIESLKNWLASGNLAVIAVDADQYDNLTTADVWTSDKYETEELNHANTIVGYDDTVSYIENGEVQTGAFKIANSWGVGGWENVVDGFYWISYEAMKKLSEVPYSNPCIIFQDLTGYEPKIVTTFNINHAVRNDLQITFSLGNATSAINKKFHNYISGGPFPFCTNNVALDLTEFMNNMTSYYNQEFYMRVYDGGTPITGTIAFYGVESANSTQTPASTIQNRNVDLHLTYSFALSLQPTSGPPLGTIILTGAGFTPGGSVNISYLNPINSNWIPIISNLETPTQDFTYQTAAPDLMQNNNPNDDQPLSDIIVFQAIDNSKSQAYNTTIPYTEYRRGLTQIGTSTPQGIYGNNTDLSASLFLKTGDTLPIVGRWFNPGNASLLWDDTNLGKIAIDETGQFNSTIIVPITSGGQHKLTISDATTNFCITLTREPIVANDYWDTWHTSDFTITLTPDYPVEETYYKINGGNTFNLSTNGQPVITTSSASNTLEYWAIWNPGEGTIENTHKTITEIKLDKTTPTGTITTAQSTTNSNIITLILSASDTTSGVTQMRFSNDGSSWSNWEQYATTKTWSLPSGDGQKTVYVQFIDNAGLTSTRSCTITLDTPKPTPTQTTQPTQTPTPTPSSTTTPTPSKMVIQSTTPPPYNIETAGIWAKPEIAVLIATVFIAAIAILLWKRKKQTA